MGMFSTAIDAQDVRWQFKTGFDDDMATFAIGDAVPYKKNEDLALDIQWPDDIYDAESEMPSSHPGFVIVRDHRIRQIIPAVVKGEQASPLWSQKDMFREIYRVPRVQLTDWSDEAQIAYHLKEVERLKAWIERRDQIGRECGDMEWYKKPGAYLRLTLREEGFMRKILPPKNETI